MILKKQFVYLLIFSQMFSFLSPLGFSAEETRLSDEELLTTIQRKSFDYFIAERDEATGLVKDRAHNTQKGATPSQASIAAVGFALTAYGVGVKNNWIDVATARQMTYQTLKFFWEQAPHEHGFFYHFMNPSTGQRSKNSELSPIDTAILLAGILFAAEYYEDAEIRDLAMKIYDRMDWQWMLHNGETFPLEWSPERGFSKLRWDHYNESMILYLFAIGSNTHPIPASSWKAIVRPVGSYKGIKVMEHPPLFTHQYSHIWVDFRNKNDGIADYFQNSVNATLANRQFCIDQADTYSTYGPNSWGLTASDGPGGYKAFGAPPGWAEHDGTIAPTGCGGSIVFTPKESIACLRHFYEDVENLWGDYGFADAFNTKKKWVASDVIGIDQGTILLMIENYRSGFIWEVMNHNAQLKKAMEAVGFKPGTKELDWPEPPQIKAPYIFGGLTVDGYFKDWPNSDVIKLDRNNKESGEIKDDQDLRADYRFAWDENYLYFAVKVKDQDIYTRRSGRNIWQDDMVELYIDPQGDGLSWYQKSDFQLGFRVNAEEEGVSAWSWFQGGEDPTEGGYVKVHGFAYGKGYQMEGAIRWNYLGMHAEPGEVVRLSVSVHDFDRPKKEGKLQWFFRNEEDWKRFALGKILLEPKKQ